MRKKLILALVSVYALHANGQLIIERNGILFIQKNASVTLQGDLNASADIEGDGSLELFGKGPIAIDMHGFSISNFVISSPAILKSDLAVRYSINMRAAHLQLSNYDLTLGNNTVASGSSEGYIQTTGAGSVKKTVPDRLSNYMIPVGTSSSYMPLQINVGEAGAGGVVTVRVNDKASNSKPEYVKDFLRSHWLIKQEGNIQGLSATGYFHQTDVQGNARRLSAYYWDGFNWKLQSRNQQGQTTTAAITSASGELYAMALENTYAEIRLLNNPARTHTVLEIKTPIEKTFHLVLRDVTGRELQRTDIKLMTGVNYHTVYLNGLDQGMYSLEVTSKTERQSFKFIKIH